MGIFIRVIKLVLWHFLVGENKHDLDLFSVLNTIMSSLGMLLRIFTVLRARLIFREVVMLIDWHLKEG